MNAAAGWPSHWVMRMTRSMSASRAVRRFVSLCWCAVERRGEACPRMSTVASLFVERRVQLPEVPTKAGIGCRVRQLRGAYIHSGSSEEVLRRSAEPSQHEQRVLAGSGTTLLQALQRPAAEWMVTTALGVEA